jgi:DNA-binding CsgD family transcriptional regulator
VAPTLSPIGCSPAVASPESISAVQGLSPAVVWMLVRDALRLSDRELRITQGIFDGQEQASIAADLHISPEVVYRTTQRIYIKLRIGSRRELKLRVSSIMLLLSQDSGSLR